MNNDNRLRLILLLLLITLSHFSAFSVSCRYNKQVLSDISDDLYYSYSTALLDLDSVRMSYSDSEIEQCSPYLDYIDGFIAFRKDDYYSAFDLSNKALYYFITKGDKEWEGKCLLLVGFIAEKMSLNEEALEAYQEAVLVCKSNQNKGLAYLGVARSQKRLFLEWNSTLRSGLALLEKTGKRELQLVKLQSPYWFYPDSINLPSDLIPVANEYEELEMFNNAGVTLKVIANFYNKIDSAQLANTYINKALLNFNKDVNVSLLSRASAVYVKGQIEQKSGDLAFAENLFLTSISLLDSAGHNQCNFNVYRNLFRQDTLSGDMDGAVVNLIAALNCKHKMGKIKIEWSQKIGVFLRDRSELINEILMVRKRNNKRVLFLLTIVSLILSYYIFNLWLRKRKAEINYRTIKSLMQDSLLEVKQKQVSKYIKTSKSEIDIKVDKHLFSKPELVSYVKDNSLNMLLHIENKMSHLTEREKKCTSLIALGCSNKDLEDLLSVKSDTIRTYRSRIRAKLEIEDRHKDLKSEILRLLNEE